MAKAPAKAKTKKIDPFKTKKTRTDAQPAGDTFTPPQPVAEAIDAFREAQEQAKHFEGEATLHKSVILEYAEGEYAKRLVSGKPKSFKLLGEETMITYVVMDASAGITDDEAEEFARQFGEKAAEELIVRDYGSVKFDAKVLEANYDAVVEALQTLPPEVLENLFRPMLHKAVPGAAEKAKAFAKKPDDLLEVLKALKIKNYIR